MKGQTHYEILDVTQAATNAELKNAYRRLVKKYHPDVSNEPDAVERIRYINEAYEVLSEHYSRAAYDRLLSGAFEAPTYSPPEETEAQKYRRDYLRKKTRDSRERLEHMIRIKVKFYRYERVVSFLFFGIGLLFTLDYYYASHVEDYRFFKMGANYKKAKITINDATIYTNFELYQQYEKSGGEVIYVEFSSVFGIPTRVGLDGKEKMFSTHYTLHSFNNIFTIIIMFFSAVVMRHKEYTDFRLSCGLVPVLLVVFQFLFVATGGGF